MVKFLFIFIIIFSITLPICYSIYLTHKWYKRGYQDVMTDSEDYKKGKRYIVNPKYSKHICNENKFWHYGAYDAYCKIKDVNDEKSNKRVD